MGELRIISARDKLTYPIPLEALLTTEKSLFAQLLTRWTLQRAGVVGAVGTLARRFLLDCDLLRWPGGQLVGLRWRGLEVRVGRTLGPWWKRSCVHLKILKKVCVSRDAGRLTAKVEVCI